MYSMCIACVYMIMTQQLDAKLLELKLNDPMCVVLTDAGLLAIAS